MLYVLMLSYDKIYYTIMLLWPLQLASKQAFHYYYCCRCCCYYDYYYYY